MFFLKKVAGFLYLLMMVLAGAVFIMAALDVASQAFIGSMLDAVLADMNIRIFVFFLGSLIVATGAIVFLRARKKKGRDKLITFQNPDGEVTVSISAIENYVRRVARDIPGIADIKAAAKVGKRGISIISSVAVSAGTNIPEATENIQMTVKSKVQEMLGIEEKIIVTINVTKILKEDETVSGVGDEERPASPPFRELD